MRPQLANTDTGAPLTADPLTANAYLGGFGIAAALASGADVVVCPRVTDAALVVGPAAWWWRWEPGDWDRLAGAVAAGHVIECGAQATGGNYAFFGELPDRDRPLGFPIAEVDHDGSCVVTKHPGTGGAVSVGTVTAQLLYEIAGPAYANPDVVARFDSCRLEPIAPDRVRISGTRGEPAPATAKVSINLLGGYRNRMTFVLTGTDQQAKADWALARPPRRLPTRPVGDDGDTVRAPRPRRSRPGIGERPAPRERAVAGRARRRAGVLVGGRGAGAGQLPRLLRHVGAGAGRGVRRVLAGAGRHRRRGTIGRARRRSAPRCRPSATDRAGCGTDRRGRGARPDRRRRHPPPGEALGRWFGARSGDKGGNANLGVWARDDDGLRWLVDRLGVDVLRRLLGVPDELIVERSSSRTSAP